VSGVAITWS